MCLRIVDKTMTLPREKGIIAYKVFSITGKHMKAPYRDRVFRTGVKVYHSVPDSITNNSGEKYVAGFHAFTARKAMGLRMAGDVAQMVGKRPATYKVRLWGKVTIGQQWGGRTAVGTKMELLERID